MGNIYFNNSSNFILYTKIIEKYEENMMYDPVMVQPMRDELTNIGIQELLTPEDVDGFFGNKTGTYFLIINSVCGCAAGGARPGLTLALKNEKKPDRVVTVFAGMEKEAAQQARSHFSELPPSSPSMVLMKDGQVVHFVPRHMIEGRGPELVAEDLIKAFDEYC